VKQRKGGANVRLLFVVVLMVAAVGIRRDAEIYLPGGIRQPWYVDGRFAKLAGKLPEHERVGYVTDATQDEAAGGHFSVLYAFAPRIVEFSSEPRFLVADLRDPAGLPALCARLHLRVLAEGDPGVALVERE
jgi:hypothetical protein